ncbi:MAG: alkaline phosphatase family protein, partial [Candidatus Krumholzibacteria bacterium]|nr:alkaline phosphatase family protein [Candidatus Krumholzibacteria bacterium]
MKLNKTQISGLAVLAIVMVVVWSTRRGPSVDAGRFVAVSGSPAGAYEFDSMRDYLRGDRPSSDHRVVFVGLDGAAWKIIDPMIESGLLPTLGRLKQEGAWGVLRSVDCYFSPPAWTSMMTGYLPQKTGVYTFGKWMHDEREFSAFSSLDVAVPFVWDVASKADRRVAVTNIPMTYPAQPVNGIMVTGLMTPIVYDKTISQRRLRFKSTTAAFDVDLDAKSYAPRLVRTLMFSLNTLVFVLYDTVDDQQTRYDTVALKVFPATESWTLSDQAPLYTFAPNEYSPWFHLDYRKKQANIRVKKKVACSVMIEPVAGDSTSAIVKMTPLLRLPSDPDLDLTHPESLASEIEREFGYYLITMTYSADLVPQGTEWTASLASYFYDYDDWDLFLYTFMAPDNIQHHEGVSERTRAVYQSIDRFLAGLLNKLPDDVTLIVASDHGFSRYDYIISLNDYLEQIGVLTNPRNVDHDSTLVFHNQWCLYFNDDLVTASELTTRGIAIADGETPRQALVAYLKDMCRQLEAAGRPMPVELIEVPEDAVGTAPDMIVVGGYGDYFIEGMDLSIQ